MSRKFGGIRSKPLTPEQRVARCLEAHTQDVLAIVRAVQQGYDETAVEEVPPDDLPPVDLWRS